MTNWKANLAKYTAALSAFLGIAARVSAQTPAYVMDSDVQTSVTDLLGSLVTTYFGIIPVALAIVGTLMVTLFGIGKLIGWVRGNMHG